MANLIITVIAIGLVAVATVAGAYYGGASFLSNGASVIASTVVNQGQQIATAWSAYRLTHLDSGPSDPALLVAGNYMAQIPMPPSVPNVNRQAMSVASATATIDAVTDTHYFAAADIGHPTIAGGSFTDSAASACMHIIKTAVGTANYEAMKSGAFPVGAGGAIFNGAGGNGTFGCGIYTGGYAPVGTSPAIQQGDYVMEYLLQ